MIFQDIQSMDESRSWHSTFQHLNMKAKEKAGTQKTGKSAVNRIYNRYRDVIPYDHSLVRLRNSDTEYINANLVKVSSINKEYILTQGPLANTCKHFWSMIWEQNTYSIVMLNRVIEKNQLKCHQYWPLAGTLTAGNIEVTLKTEEDCNEFIVRDLELYNEQEDKRRSVKHFHYVAWPDFGVPRSPQAFLKFLFRVREYQSSIPGVGPPIVHCSAGIGRSGTFALIDAALTEIKQKDDMMDYDVKKILLEMRTYRAGLIQTMEQLRFSYIAILEGANMVAPEAYGAAYWKMANQEEDETEAVENEDENKEEDSRVLGKRKEDEYEENEEPKAKEARRDEEEEQLEKSSESDGEEDEVIDLADDNLDLLEDRIKGEDNLKSSESDGEEDEVIDLANDNLDLLEDRIKGEDKLNNEDFHETGALREDAIKEDVADKGGTKEEEQLDHDQNESNESFVQDRYIRTTTSTTDDSIGFVCCTFPRTTEKRHEQFETKDGEVVCDAEGVSSDRVSAVRGNDVSTADREETVLGRWQSGDGEGTDSGEQGNEPRPTRSAMRTNSTEGKRKSVSFVEGNSEEELGIDEETFETDEKDRESSTLRRRQIEERKQKLSDKVDSIKKKMKDKEDGGSFFGKTIIAGLVICVVVAGAAFFYYHYQS